MATDKTAPTACISHDNTSFTTISLQVIVYGKYCSTCGAIVRPEGTTMVICDPNFIVTVDSHYSVSDRGTDIGHIGGRPLQVAPTIPRRAAPY